MSIASRKALYTEIEELRERPLIVYATSQRIKASGQMGADVLPDFCDQVLSLPPKCSSVDLLIVSTGGDPMVAWRMISILREKVKKIGVLVPREAYSAATLLALGADEIIMHPFGNLGPIDPQITSVRKGVDGKRENIHYSAEDMYGFLDFAREKASLSDQQQMAEAFKLICSEAGALSIGFALRSSRLSQLLGIKLLQTHHRRHKNDDRKTRDIVEHLNKQFFNHGYALSRTEAKEIGLNVVFPKENLESAMWKLCNEIEYDMKSRIPFDPISLMAQQPFLAELFKGLPSVQLPTNVPEETKQAIWEKCLQHVCAEQYPSFDVVTINALLESKKHQRMYKTMYRISPFRAHNGHPDASMTITHQGWDNSLDEAS